MLVLFSLTPSIMLRKLLLLFALTIVPFALYAQDDDEVIILPDLNPVVINNVVFGTKYTVNDQSSFSATLHVKESGLIRVMCSSSDYPYPYRDAAHTDLIDFVNSFYDNGQGYILSVQAGETIYFYRNFCMNPGSKVWFEKMSAPLSYTPSQTEGTELSPTGIAQLSLVFNQPVSCSGATMTCCGETVTFGEQHSTLYLTYPFKTIIMDWLECGMPTGSEVTIIITGVRSYADANILYGTDGTIVLHYLLPEKPGRLLSTNFENRLFKSYWLPDDEEGIFRMTFSRPVNVEDPGYINLVYGNQDLGDINSLTYYGRAEGNDIVFDFRDMFLRPKDLLPESGNNYTSIMLRPGSVRDEKGNYMYSEGNGTLASWTYELVYTYLSRTPKWEITGYDGDDFDDPLVEGSIVEFYVYDYDYIRYDGISLTFEDGTKVIVPKTDLDIDEEYYLNSGRTYATIDFYMPRVIGNHSQVTIAFHNLRFANGEGGNVITETTDCHYEIPTGISSSVPTEAAPIRRDLQGRRTHHNSGLIIEGPRKSIR